MTATVTFDWTATREESGILLYEHDIEVSVDVHEDGDTIIRSLALFQDRHEYTVVAGVTQWLGKRRIGRIDLMGAGDVFLRQLGLEIIARLQADEGFVGKAHEEAGLEFVGRGANDPDSYYRFRDLEAAE